MSPLKKHSLKNNKALLLFPVYLSLLATNNNDNIDEAEKSAAIKFLHIKTFTCDSLLINFYKEAEKNFEKAIIQLNEKLPKDKKLRELAILKELLILEKIALNLDKKYIVTMYKSMESFKNHVSKAHHNVLIDFIFPISIKGLT
ncbi:MAG: hypothetical protein A2X12_01600 [Bacteroidetes bacterium GWE2_29_8]|nr:MAG: hypothetical protein A2X12_01600 [Bacteroidetes bacterium GWE2_29_8]